MTLSRRCTRAGCGRAAVATLTYVYRDQTAVLGPLATYAEPHTYDLCSEHAARLTAPLGWEVVRLTGEAADPPAFRDDLLALADAVREAAAGPGPAEVVRSGSGASDGSRRTAGQEGGAVELTRRRHLRVLKDG